MNAGNWFVLKREHDPAGLPYSWPDATRRMWKERVKERAGRGLRKTIEGMKRDLGQVYPTPAIFVIYPGEYAMSGHLASIRKTWENMQLFNFECWRTGIRMTTRGRYFETSAVVIWTPYVLRKLAELSPVFVPIWNDLKDKPSSECGIYLADAPNAAWLESIRPDEERLYAEFRDARHLDMIGLDLGRPKDDVAQQQERAFELLMEEKYEEGEALLKDLVARCPVTWRAHWDLAWSAIWQENPRRALAVIQRARKQFPDCLNFDRLAVDCAIKLKNWTLAEWHLKRLWGLNPWDPNLLLRYAGVAFSRGDYALAVMLYEDCAEGGPLGFSGQTEYGIALSKVKRGKEALAVLRNLEKDNPDSPNLLNNIGFILASEGHPVEALRYCRRAVELAPGQEYIWDSLGFVQYKTRNYREATRAFLKAVDLNPTFPDAWRHLLHAYHMEGRMDRLEGAKSYVSRVLPDQLTRFEREKGAEILD